MNFAMQPKKHYSLLKNRSYVKEKISFLLLILLFVSCFISQATPRKKVALVLSGGGAKGAAHVGALKVIENMGVPIDYIVGTSIGAIIGGLYSTGYSPEQLETLIKNSNWMDLLSDKISRNQIPFPYKSEADKYLFSLILGQRNCGILKGHNISHLLEELTTDFEQVTDFNKLPIPFACIATDIVTNKIEIIRSGNLVTAMRASMAIPIAFEPIFVQDKVLIDGGFKDNLPVNVAKTMGADIIIAVDVQSNLATSEELQSIGDVANQLMLMICQSNNNLDYESIDSYMKINVNGFTAASFTPEAMDTLILRGEETAMQHQQELKAILKETGQKDSRRNGSRTLKEIIPLYTPNIKDKQLKVGLRFDSEDIAAFTLAYHIPIHKKHAIRFNLRGGKQSFFQTDYHIQLNKSQATTLSNKIGYNDYFIYANGDKITNPTYLQNTTMLSYSIVPQRNLQFKAGIALDYHRHFQTLTSHLMPLQEKENLFLNYHIQMEYESLDKIHFPTKGSFGNICYTLYRDLQSSVQSPVLRTSMGRVFPITTNTYLIPTLNGRFMFKDNMPFIYQNSMGGEGYNLRNEHQIPFSGFTHIELMDRFLGSIQANIRHRIKKDHYVSLSGNMAFTSHQFSSILNDKRIYGVSVGYGYDSPLGPIEGSIGYSNHTDNIGFHINIGFGF